MASTVAIIAGGIVTFAQLVITADLIGIYNKTDGFPSGEVRNVLIYALITAIWGVLLALVLPIVSSQYRNAGLDDSASPNALFFTFIVYAIAAALLTKAAIHGGACTDKSAQTCHLYTAALALEWVMTGFALVAMVVASWLNARAGTFRNDQYI